MAVDVRPALVDPGLGVCRAHLETGCGEVRCDVLIDFVDMFGLVVIGRLFGTGGGEERHRCGGGGVRGGVRLSLIHI